MEIIKYHNDINKIKLGSFTDNETDIFFGILLKTKETKDNTLNLSFTELKRLIDVKHRNNDRFIENVRGLNIKLKSLIQEIELPNGDFKVFSLFDDITTSPSRNQVEIEINKNFRYLIEGLMANYTEIDLKQLVSLKGNYPKVLYRLLKQFESSKIYVVKIDDFRDLMGIPNTYQMINIRQKIFKPCLEQLKKYFIELEIIEMRKGRKTETLKFIWKQKKKKQVEEIKAIKKKQVLGEKDLKEHQEQLQEREEKNVIDPLEQVEKIKIPRVSYGELYKKYLQDNKLTHNPFVRKAFDIANKNKYEIIEFQQPNFEQTKIYTVENITEDKLLDKNGNKLKGMLLNNRINKILKEMNKNGSI